MCNFGLSPRTVIPDLFRDGVTLRTAKPFRLALAAFYRIGYKLHHRLFLRPQPPLRVPIVIVGSYLAGGAEFILLQNSLSHSAKVIATSNRYSTAKEIQDKFDIILCDDGFEDTRFTGVRYICLNWQEPPTSWKSLLPNGPFRSLKQDHDESKITHIRCFDADSQTPDIRFYIKSITNYIPGKPLSATLICGLGSPKRFIDDIGTFAASTGIQINKVITRPDHDKHFAQVVQKEISCGNDIIISQKDACRLPQTNLEHPKLHIAIQEIEVSAHLTLHSS